jgi:regulator of sigma E protease
LDANPNAGNPAAVNLTPGPGGDRPADRPATAAEASPLKSWLRQNAVSLLITVAVVVLVLVYLDPIDTLKVLIGLGLVIFIHELGHFLAAKWCDVHVKTFSIGFGPAVPFCTYKWGETTYMLGIIPLGGYVSMVGEGEAADGEEAEEDPRSFRRKTVGQRMLIISAGVIMNVLLGMLCFVAAYLHGVQEKPATVGTVESGGAAWRVGMRADDDILRIGSRERPFFNDIRPIVMSTLKDEKVDVVVRHADGRTDSYQVYPLKDEGVRFPQLGIQPPYRLTLLSLKRKGFRPTIPGSPAAAASDPGFEPGDRIVGMTDPDDPGRVSRLRPDPRDPALGPDINDYYQRMARLADRPITFRVLRRDQPHDGPTVDVLVQPAYRADLGVRMRMGEIVALRSGGPAEVAGVVVRSEAPPTNGDRIKTVKLPEAGGRQTWFTTADLKDPGPNITVRRLDPLLLPLEINRWADRNPHERTVKIEVLRKVEHEEARSVELTLTYDPTFRHDRLSVSLPNSPLAVSGLGLAYWVEAVVDETDPDGPAAGLLQPNDIVTAVRFRTAEAGGGERVGDWEDVKAHQWASVDAAFQTRPPYRLDLKVKRGDEELEVSLAARPDRNWPTDDRGLVFQQDYRTQKATDILDALSLGAHRTLRFIREVYMNLYAMIFGRVSARTMSGPLTIANVSYRFAGEDFWQFLLFLGMISVNLAVVNFLPIPVLDGGHMVFLVLEKVLGRPVPERVFAIAMYTGVFLILSLMVFVIYLDVRRLFFGLF